jgi:hypothetical protein
MENTGNFNKSFGSSAILIDKVHNCAECPLRKMAMQQPNSVFAKIHAWHKTWWPGWKVHQARTCPLAANAGTRA